MKLYDARGREVEAGNQVWTTTARYEPYTAFRERPEDSDLRRLFADELPPNKRGRSVASAR